MTVYFPPRPDEGIPEQAVVDLADVLHDEAIGCDTHYPPHRSEDGFSVEAVHQHDALVLLRGIKRRMPTFAAITDGAK